MKRVLISALCVSSIAAIALGQQGTTERVSVSSAGVQGNNDSSYYMGGSPSGDGRYVVFTSFANNLVPGDGNGTVDLFLRDRKNSITTMLSVSPTGQPGNEQCGYATISANGRYVVFDSGASNLVANDVNGFWDIFVRDLQTNQTSIVSRGAGGTLANGPSYNPCSISADGRYIAFESSASNLVPNDTNNAEDIFVRDQVTGVISRVSVSSLGIQAMPGNTSPLCLLPAISGDGRFVTFMSFAENLVPNDTNGQADIFLHDRLTGETTRVSVSPSGQDGNGQSTSSAIDFSGRYIAFTSRASNLVTVDTNGNSDVFLYDRNSGTTSLVSRPFSIDFASIHGGQLPSISSDGRFIAYSSWTGNQVPGDTNDEVDIFVFDSFTNVCRRVSISSAGSQGSGVDQSSGPSVLSSDGRVVAFGSGFNNLVAGDTNGQRDVFTHQYGPDFSVSGNLVLLDAVETPTLPGNCQIEIRESGGSLVTSAVVPLSATGAFSIPGPRFAGPYYISVKHSHWLRRRIGPIDISSDVSGLVISLINGDVDEDNVVSILDYIRLSDAFDTDSSSPNWLANADLDGDGVVSIFDYIVLSDNFDTQGD